MNHKLPGVEGHYSRPSTEALSAEIARCLPELMILPDYVKNLAQAPQATFSYEAFKLTLRWLPLGPEKSLEVTNQVKEIDESTLPLSEKWNNLYELAS